MSQASYNEIAINEVLALAINQHENKNFAEAEKLYRVILHANPKHPDANYNLGILALDMGYAQEAISLFEKAIQAYPSAEAYYLAYMDAYTLIETETNTQNISSRNSKEPSSKELNTWSILYQNRNHQKAKAFAEIMTQKYPKSGIAWKIFGTSLIEIQEYQESLCANKIAIRLLPKDPEIPYHIGVAFQILRMFQAATRGYRRAIHIHPDYLEAYNNLGTVLNKQGHIAEGIACYEKALAVKSDRYKVYNNLGAALSNQGLFNEADKYLRKALDAQSDFVGAFGNLLFALNYDADKTAEEIYEMYQEYNRRIVLPFDKYNKPHGNNKNIHRRLKIGYVSPDFFRHSIRHFIEPLFENHDHALVEIYAYAQLAKEDEITQRYKSYCDHWITTIDMSDDALAQRIREDEIDILVDLAGHTSGNRLEVFARKPAPVSVSWLGYGYTTGVSAIDYYLTDKISVPCGSEHLFAEKPWRIEAPGFTYKPVGEHELLNIDIGMGEVNTLPFYDKGYITFGTLTRSIRINHRTIRVWAELLKRVENSRLIINSKDYQAAEMQETLEKRFEEHGIEKERLEIGYSSPPWDVLRRMDIGVDCFPHNSGTTLFETLYMGVPYVTLADRVSVGRLGSAILHGLGRDEWIANTEEEYSDKLAAMAADIPALAAIRFSLREEMKKSKLMDAQGFTKKVENAYREMFEKWCQG